MAAQLTWDGCPSTVSELAGACTPAPCGRRGALRGLVILVAKGLVEDVVLVLEGQVDEAVGQLLVLQHQL